MADGKGDALIYKIGTKGFWIDDNEYCEIVAVVDEGAGMYEFRSLDDIEFTQNPNWYGFIENFFPEDPEC